MSELLASLRRDALRLAIALVGLALAEALVRWSTVERGQLPVALLLLPVLAIALVAEGPATGAVAAGAIALGSFEYRTGDFSANDLRLRFAALVIGCFLAVGLASVRSTRELTLRRQAEVLSAARARAATEVLLQVMVQRLPELTAAADVVTASQRACVLARDLFGADVVSYWHVDGEETVLWGRVPDDGPFEPEARRPRPLMSGQGGDALELSRTAWVRRSDVTDPALAEVMRQVGAAAGTATPVLLGGLPIGYLTMSWAEDREPPDPFWLDALDRFADQVALAKTVIRRRATQDEMQSLARRFQAGMLPELPDDGAVAVRALYRPGLSQMLLGGDFLDARVDERGRVCFVLGDVTGHGPEQAALGATLRGAWRGVASVPGLSIEDWASSLHSVVRESTNPEACVFATAVMGRLDPVDRSLTYVSAGHPPPLLLCHGASSGPLGDEPLGLLDESTFTSHRLDVTGVRGVLLVTDGLYEGRRGPGEPSRFDHDSFVQIVLERGFADLDDGGYLGGLADEMERFNGEPLPDDAAALLLGLRTGA